MANLPPLLIEARTLFRESLTSHTPPGIETELDAGTVIVNALLPAVSVVATISKPGLLPEAVVSTVNIRSKVPPTSVTLNALELATLILKSSETEVLAPIFIKLLPLLLVMENTLDMEATTPDGEEISKNASGVISPKPNLPSEVEAKINLPVPPSWNNTSLLNIQSPVTVSFWDKEAGPPEPQSNLIYEEEALKSARLTVKCEASKEIEP